jgi:hypothetical protein
MVPTTKCDSSVCNQLGGLVRTIAAFERTTKEQREAIEPEWRQFVKDHGDISEDDFVRVHEGLRALRDAGLDFHGGITAFRGICRYILRKRRPIWASLPNSNVLVVDAEKARKDVNLGVHIGTDIPEHPLTLAEAADAFAKISALVTDRGSVEQVEIMIKDDTVESWHRTADRISALKRTRFRLQTKERYRQILLDMAHGERLEEQVKLSAYYRLIEH